MKNTVSGITITSRRSLRSRIITIACLAAAMVVFALLPEVFAQDADWAKPVTTVLGRVRAGVKIIGVSIFTVSLLMLGIQYLLNREFQIKALYGLVGGALLIFAGEGSIESLFGA